MTILNWKRSKKYDFELRPKIVIPVHYGAFEHYKEPIENIKERNDERIRIVEVGSKVELKIKNTSR